MVIFVFVFAIFCGASSLSHISFFLFYENNGKQRRCLKWKQKNIKKIDYGFEYDEKTLIDVSLSFECFRFNFNETHKALKSLSFSLIFNAMMMLQETKLKVKKFFFFIFAFFFSSSSFQSNKTIQTTKKEEKKACLVVFLKTLWEA